MLPDSTEPLFADRIEVIKHVRIASGLGPTDAKLFTEWYLEHCPKHLRNWRKLNLMVELAKRYENKTLVLDGNTMWNVKEMSQDELEKRFGITLKGAYPPIITQKTVYEFPS